MESSGSCRSESGPRECRHVCRMCSCPCKSSLCPAAQISLAALQPPIRRSAAHDRPETRFRQATLPSQPRRRWWSPVLLHCLRRPARSEEIVRGDEHALARESGSGHQPFCEVGYRRIQIRVARLRRCGADTRESAQCCSKQHQGRGPGDLGQTEAFSTFRRQPGAREGFSSCSWGSRRHIRASGIQLEPNRKKYDGLPGRTRRRTGGAGGRRTTQMAREYSATVQELRRGTNNDGRSLHAIDVPCIRFKRVWLQRAISLGVEFSLLTFDSLACARTGDVMLDRTPFPVSTGTLPVGSLAGRADRRADSSGAATQQERALACRVPVAVRPARGPNRAADGCRARRSSCRAAGEPDGRKVPVLGNNSKRIQPRRRRHS